MKVFRNLALMMLGSVQLLAVPAWSRLTGTSCTACHATPTWQLTPTGLEFLKNGHRLEATKVDKKDQVLDHYISLVWKGRAYSDTLDSKRTGNANLQKPSNNFEQHSFSLYTGGALSDRFSYFTELYLSENTGSTSGSNIVQGDGARKKLAEAFLQYNHPINDKAFLAVRAGEILPGILHVFGVGARSAEQRAVVLNDALQGAANSAQNQYKPFSRQQGVDATLNWHPVEVSFGIVNGSATNVTNSIDSDGHKDWFASFLWSFDSNESAVGLYHYDGTFANYGTANDFSTTLNYNNAFTKDALLFRFIRPQWRVVAAYFTGKETVNLGTAALTPATFVKGTTKNVGYYLLADWNFTDTLGLYVRYDALDPNKDVSNNDVKMVLVGLNGTLYQSEKSGARWNVEYTERETWNSASASVPGTLKFKDKKVFAQITWGF
jgi:hypothetical protein